MQVASTAPLGKISTGFAGAVHRFAQERAIPIGHDVAFSLTAGSCAP